MTEDPGVVTSPRTLPPDPDDVPRVVRADPNRCAGKVRDIKQETDVELVGPRFVRWFRSLFRGIPYSPIDEKVTFEVYSDDDSREHRVSVEAYGHIDHLATNLNVEVHGRRNRDGVILARRIYAIDEFTGSRQILRDPRQRSAAAVRLITLLALALFFVVVFCFIPASQSFTDTFGDIIAFSVTGLLIVLLIRGSVNQRRYRGTRTRR